MVHVNEVVSGLGPWFWRCILITSLPTPAACPALWQIPVLMPTYHGLLAVSKRSFFILRSLDPVKKSRDVGVELD